MRRALSFSFALGLLACGETHDAPANFAGNGGSAATGGAGTGGTSGVATTSGAGGQATQAGAPVNEGGNSGSPTSGGSSLAGSSLGGSSLGGASAGEGGGAPTEPLSLLIFSKTAEYRHDSIPAGIEALTKLAGERGWQVDATEDSSRFSDTGLAGYGAVIFLSTTGDVLDDDQQAAFERFIRGGRGFVGIHSATDTEYDWAWYGALVGAYFREHPAVQAADVLVEDGASVGVSGLPKHWNRTDEWYAFRSNPRANVSVLLSLDESSYTPGVANMNGDHPIAWSHDYDGGRAFYTALGHTKESYADPLFIGHVAGGISWVLGLE